MGITCNDLISAGYSKECAREPKKGFGREAIILNYDDIDWENIVQGASANLITTFPLLSGGKRGYQVINYKNPFNGSNKALAEGTYYNSVDKTFIFATLTRDQEQSLNLDDPMLNGKFVAIVKNEDGGSDGKCTYEILGYHNGLKLVGYDENPYGDTFGGALFTLKESEAPRTAMYLYDTSVAATTTKVQGYLSPTVTPGQGG